MGDGGPVGGSSLELARRGLLCFLYVARMYPRNSLRSTRGCEGVFKQREIKCIRWEWGCVCEGIFISQPIRMVFEKLRGGWAY